MDEIQTSLPLKRQVLHQYNLVVQHCFPDNIYNDHEDICEDYT